eukprot:TRINITY_DN106275_c0_g1_i2.p1 TRINITY_DN106275_c0_g1~~TRINITY_DN106275_c0_g1_i2.p1  ORF type:complete len:128 (-),score=36.59 TRINITY_DN106275_c0_g1_i2:163-546(-)
MGDLAKRRRTVLDAVQAEEDDILTSLSSVEKDRASLKAHAETMKKLADCAANDALLGTLTTLTSRLQGLEQAMGTGQQAGPRLEVTFDDQKLAQLKQIISALGKGVLPHYVIYHETDMTERLHICLG